jgi:hypothetical protein
MMSLACWKAIFQPVFSLSYNILTSFNYFSLMPHGIIPSFPMQLGGKTMYVEVEVVDVPLDYNLLLGRSWAYSMHVVVATIFPVLLFPHEGRIMTIDQLSFSRIDPSLGESMVPMIDNPQPGIVNMGVGFFPPLMGTSNYRPPSSDVKMISVVLNQPRPEIFQVSSFCMTYFNDLWTLPSPSASMEWTRHPVMSILLSMVEVVYSTFQEALVNPDLTPTSNLDPILEPT